MKIMLVVLALTFLPFMGLTQTNGCPSNLSQVVAISKWDAVQERTVMIHSPAQPGDVASLTFDSGEYATLETTLVSTGFQGTIELIQGIYGPNAGEQNIGGYHRGPEYIKAGRTRTISVTFQIPCNWYATRCATDLDWYSIIELADGVTNCNVQEVSFQVSCSSGCVGQP